MAKKIDITEKIDFDSKKILVIKGNEIEVDDSATTVLKVMGALGNNNAGTPKGIVDMYNLIFPEKSRLKIEELKLNFAGFNTVVESAINLIVDDGGDEEGE